MSDSSISLVPRLSTFPDYKEKAKEILDWLIHLDIVQPSKSDCVLGKEGGYALSKGAEAVVVDPEDLPHDYDVNGLAIITKRRVFDNGGNGIEEVVCPSCKQNIEEEDWDFLNDWAAGKTDAIICPLCHDASDIHKYTFSPSLGFSNLGFTFWNWPPFTDDFINAFRSQLGADFDIVYSRI